MIRDKVLSLYYEKFKLCRMIKNTSIANIFVCLHLSIQHNMYDTLCIFILLLLKKCMQVLINYIHARLL